MLYADITDISKANEIRIVSHFLNVFWHFWHERVWLSREWVGTLGKGLAWFYISANNGFLGKCIIQLNAEIYCWKSVMTISKPI